MVMSYLVAVEVEFQYNFFNFQAYAQQTGSGRVDSKTWSTFLEMSNVPKFQMIYKNMLQFKKRSITILFMSKYVHFSKAMFNHSNFIYLFIIPF